MAGPATNGNGQIQKRQVDPAREREASLIGMIQSMGPEIQRALPKHITADRIARIAMTAVRMTPHLAECSTPSVLACLLSSAQLGLEVNTPMGHAYLIPRKNKSGAYECTLMLGYQGLLSLVDRSGCVTERSFFIVHQGDHFEYEYGLNPNIIHKPCANPGEMTHGYATAKLANGGRAFLVMTKREIDARKARGAQGPAWRTDYESMAKKTLAREFTKWLPKSAEMAMAAQVDETVERGGRVADATSPEVIDVLASANMYEPSGDALVDAIASDEPTEDEIRRNDAT